MSATLLIAGALSVGGALAVILSTSPVHSVVALIVNFIGLAGLYLSLQAEFLAIAQVIVYAGAVMILFLFVIALLTVKREPREHFGARTVGSFAALRVGAAALVAILLVGAAFLADETPTAPVSDEFGTVSAVGIELFTTHVLSFEAAALVLLVAVIGVVVLVGRREKGRERA